MSLLNALLDLRDLVDSGEWNKSICRYLCENNYFHYRSLFLEIASKWPKYSGVMAFPVPYKFGDLNLPGYAFQTQFKWEGQYGEDRRELLDFAINYLREVNGVQLQLL